MQNVLVAAAVLACPVGMGAMMWFMGKGMRRDQATSSPRLAPSLEQLREEHERLGDQIERMEGDRSVAPS